jgi:hypothetical protein
MRNKNVSDFVANTMASLLKSAEHQSLFNPYKYASAQDSQDANQANDDIVNNDVLNVDEKKDTSCADDNCADNNISTAYDIAIDSLLTASAALDSLGLGKGSAFSLKLASFVVEAKKKDSKEVANKKNVKKDKEDIEGEKESKKSKTEVKSDKKEDKKSKTEVKPGKEDKKIKPDVKPSKEDKKSKTEVKSDKKYSKK